MATVSRKSSAVVLNLDKPAVAYLVDALKLVARDPVITMPSELVITSGNDSTHGKNSRHYRNEAIDIRSKNFPSSDAKHAFRSRYETVLGERFRVLLENEGEANEHFHAQVRMGQTFEG
jgi:hypothetical protein